LQNELICDRENTSVILNYKYRQIALEKPICQIEFNWL